MKRDRRFVLILGVVLAVVVLLGGCEPSDDADGAQENDASGERVSVAQTEGIVWGEGNKGAVLAHGAAYDAASWEEQGRTLGEHGVMALAVEDTSPYNLRSAIEYLKKEYRVERVTLVGASAGAGRVLQAAEDYPEGVGQIILLSGSGDVSGLGEYPKLFVASEGEEASGEARRMADEAPGDLNEALILPGDAHAQAIFQTKQGERLMQVILERIEEYG